jgi:hypothetical protein
MTMLQPLAPHVSTPSQPTGEGDKACLLHQSAQLSAVCPMIRQSCFHSLAGLLDWLRLVLRKYSAVVKDTAALNPIF